MRSLLSASFSMLVCTFVCCSSSLWWSDPSAGWLQQLFHDPELSCLFFLSDPWSVLSMPHFFFKHLISWVKPIPESGLLGAYVFVWCTWALWSFLVAWSMVKSQIFCRRTHDGVALFLLPTSASKELSIHLFRVGIMTIQIDVWLWPTNSFLPLKILIKARDLCLHRKSLPLRCVTNWASNTTDLVVSSRRTSSSIPSF